MLESSPVTGYEPNVQDLEMLGNNTYFVGPPSIQTMLCMGEDVYDDDGGGAKTCQVI